ncbi:P-loop containing nucleoside triphosphate hydrolase protein [Mycena galericulata]|nr:P-loop containing nucleoside triphosphate hydrolase protein [Mycena galericulata]
MADAPFTLVQDIFKLDHPPIRVTPVHEIALNQHLVQQFLDTVPVGGAIGLAPAYGRNCALSALAFSSAEQVLLVYLARNAPRPRRNNRTTNKEKDTPTLTGREFLHSLIFCAAGYAKYAFRMDLLALALFFDHRLRIAHAVDLLSAAQEHRGSLAALMSALGGEAGLQKANLITLFRHEENIQAPVSHLALQAWVAGRAGSAEAMAARLKEVPRIDTSAFNQARLFALAKLSREARRLIDLKPTRVENEVDSEFSCKEGKLNVTSTRFRTRVLASSNQRIEVESTTAGKTSTFCGKAIHVDGRAAHIKIASAERAPFRGDSIRVTTVGRERPTRAEAQRAQIVLHALQRTTTLLASPFFQALWLPGEYPVWPARGRAGPAPRVYFPAAKLNASQAAAVRAMLSDADKERVVVVVQGPPGTGKTTVIAAAVMSILSAAEDVERTVWVVAQSNVAVKNIAEKLADVELDFTLLVSKDFHYDWHEHLYGQIMDNVLRSDELKDDFSALEQRMLGSRVVLCTLSMLSNPHIAPVLRLIPLTTLMVDEASQVEIGDFVPVLHRFSTSLEKLVFIGDDKQLPPYGQSNIDSLQSVFELEHLRKEAIFLDTQCMPEQLGAFIGKHVYGGKLKSVHRITTPCCRFINVEGKETTKGRSWINVAEAHATIAAARECHESGRSYRILTPYDAQRALLEATLKAAKIPWENKVFCVDSFQGNEDEYILVSTVRTERIGFLAEERRVNVMLSRCKKGMTICTNRAFLEGAAKDSLVGRLASEMGESAWC